MVANYETLNRRKALITTLISYSFLLLIFFIIRFHSQPPAQTKAADLIEINLGNDIVGDGDEQPLVKGNKTPMQEQSVGQTQATDPESGQTNTSDDGDAETAGITKTKNTQTLTNTDKTATEKTKNPLFIYKGDKKGPNGNNDDEDNWSKSQGKNKGAIGDEGDPNGTTSGIKIIEGNRKIVQNYEFTGDLKRATIKAKIHVSASGKGMLTSILPGSTNTGLAYQNAIKGYLQKISFNRSSEESDIVIKFYFDIQ